MSATDVKITKTGDNTYDVDVYRSDIVGGMPFTTSYDSLSDKQQSIENFIYSTNLPKKSVISSEITTLNINISYNIFINIVKDYDFYINDCGNNNTKKILQNVFYSGSQALLHNFPDSMRRAKIEPRLPDIRAQYTQFKREKVVSISSIIIDSLLATQYVLLIFPTTFHEFNVLLITRDAFNKLMSNSNVLQNMYWFGITIDFSGVTTTEDEKDTHDVGTKKDSASVPMFLIDTYNTSGVAEFKTNYSLRKKGGNNYSEALDLFKAVAGMFFDGDDGNDNIDNLSVAIGKDLTISNVMLVTEGTKQNKDNYDVTTRPYMGVIPFPIFIPEEPIAGLTYNIVKNSKKRTQYAFFTKNQLRSKAELKKNDSKLFNGFDAYYLFPGFVDDFTPRKTEEVYLGLGQL